MPDTHALGRFHAPEPSSALLSLHIHDGRALKPVDHEPRVAVLDQEDLHAQGINCGAFIPGAGNPDALGSCTANTFIEALSNLMDDRRFSTVIANLGKTTPDPDLGYRDTVAAERAAIGFYHACTDQTSSTVSEWPPSDVGSSGAYVYREALAQSLIGSQEVAHGLQNVCSLMQTGGCLLGMPWMNAWFEPDAHGFIDGDGTASDIQAGIRSGVAGGHEIFIAAVEKVVLTQTGHVIPEKTVLRCRNHWTGAWGDHGSFRLHGSLLVALGGYIDVRQFRA